MNCLLEACAIAFELEWVFPSRAIEMFGGAKFEQERPVCEFVRKPANLYRGRRSSCESSTGLELPGESVAECPGPEA